MQLKPSCVNSWLRIYEFYRVFHVSSMSTKGQHGSFGPFRFFFGVNHYFLVINHYLRLGSLYTVDYWRTFWLQRSGFFGDLCVSRRDQCCNFCDVMKRLQNKLKQHPGCTMKWIGIQWCRWIYPEEITVAPLVWLQQLLLHHASKRGERHIVDLWRNSQRERSRWWWLMTLIKPDLF